MESNYNPTRKEISIELRNEIIEIGQLILATAIAPYVIPTATRCYNQAPKQKDSPAGIGAVVCSGLAVGVVIDALQAGGYCYLAQHDHPEAVLIPIATNVISSCYEYGRHLYKSAKQRVIDNHINRNGLEKKITMQ